MSDTPFTPNGFGFTPTQHPAQQNQAPGFAQQTPTRAPENNQQHADEETNNSSENNNSTNPKNFDNLWADEQEPASQTNSQPPASPNANVPEIQTQIEGYLNNMGLSAVELNQQDIQNFQENPSAFLNEMNSRIRKAHVAGLNAADRLVKEQLSKFRNEMGSMIDKNADSREITTFLESNLPDLMRDPGLRPMVAMVAGQFEKKGVARKDIPNQVKEYLSYIQSKAPNTGNPDSRQNFRSQQETNWNEFFNFLE